MEKNRVKIPEIEKFNEHRPDIRDIKHRIITNLKLSQKKI
jgi:hypothetical protein